MEYLLVIPPGGPNLTRGFRGAECPLLGRDADKASQCARVCGSVLRDVLLRSEERRFFCKENFLTMVRIVSLLIPGICCYRISVSLFSRFFFDFLFFLLLGIVHIAWFFFSSLEHIGAGEEEKCLMEEAIVL